MFLKACCHTVKITSPVFSDENRRWFPGLGEKYVYTTDNPHVSSQKKHKSVEQWWWWFAMEGVGGWRGVVKGLKFINCSGISRNHFKFWCFGQISERVSILMLYFKSKYSKPNITYLMCLESVFDLNFWNTQLTMRNSILWNNRSLNCSIN